MKIKSSLYIKYVVVAVLIMVMSGVIGFLATNMYYHRVVKEKNDAKNVAIVSEMAAYIVGHPGLSLEEHMAMLGKAGYQIYVVNERGEEGFYGGPYRLKELDDQVIEDVLAGKVFHGIRDYPRQLFVTGFFANDLQNSVGIPFTFNGIRYAMFVRPNISLLFSEVHTILGGLALLVPLISLLAILLSAWYIIRPIKELTAGTARIASEDYDATVRVNRFDELGMLANSFNKMARQLKANEEARKSFIRNVSHDFQSPLQNISGYAALLKRENLDAANREQYASVIESETWRLSNLTKQLLLLTSLDQPAAYDMNQSVALHEQVEAAVMKYNWLLEKEKISVWLDIDEVFVKGNETLLENVWENLLTNAIKYNQPGGDIRISIKMENGQINVSFEDTGIGIAEEDLPRVVEQFYRGDTSRSTKGTGLGLAIVTEVMELHHGELQIASKPGKGTKVTVLLPKS
ncbi:sensor histidine kinase [Bacillus thermotolerans]|uniref:sensor histidine kinase n=1 Tax=Bacillus thermotolerans TaxID=1221996 RepID=UPI00057CC627|nr:HAMP domain-containing sensor histidine kinase [Bacillus thermotolerans]KKB33923.1 Sensor histidine kinase colocalized with HrtAB transporter [Bacillus thermotolerans]